MHIYEQQEKKLPTRIDYNQAHFFALTAHFDGYYLNKNFFDKLHRSFRFTTNLFSPQIILIWFKSWKAEAWKLTLKFIHLISICYCSPIFHFVQNDNIRCVFSFCSTTDFIIRNFLALDTYLYLVIECANESVRMRAATSLWGVRLPSVNDPFH